MKVTLNDPYEHRTEHKNTYLLHKKYTIHTLSQENLFPKDLSDPSPQNQSQPQIKKHVLTPFCRLFNYLFKTGFNFVYTLYLTYNSNYRIYFQSDISHKL